MGKGRLSYRGHCTAGNRIEKGRERRWGRGGVGVGAWELGGGRGVDIQTINK